MSGSSRFRVCGSLNRGISCWFRVPQESSALYGFCSLSLLSFRCIHRLLAASRRPVPRFKLTLPPNAQSQLLQTHKLTSVKGGVAFTFGADNEWAILRWTSAQAEGSSYHTRTETSMIC